ncbi:MAG TPA: cytochrome c [Gemmatimonadales bacterium]|nr:cytochrome c [Gemmatimonadales bacterium]
MTRSSKFVVFGLVVGALAWCDSAAQAQAMATGGLTVDANLAKRGKTVWNNRGCAACHTIGKGRVAGPDLAGVTERRSIEWLKRWLKAPEQMYESDSIAKQLLDEAKGIKMPNLKLSDADIDAVIHYVVQEGQKKKG